MVFDIIDNHKKNIFLFLKKVADGDKKLLLKSDMVKMLAEFEEVLKEHNQEVNSLKELINLIEEVIVFKPKVYISFRPSIAKWHLVGFDVESLLYRELAIDEFLDIKETLIEEHKQEPWVFRFNVGPFNAEFPKVDKVQDIGRGIEFLNAFLVEKLKNEKRFEEAILEFLNVHEYQGRQLMCNDRIKGVSELNEAIFKAMDLLESTPSATPYQEIDAKMQELGFEIGWGDTVKRARRSFRLLSQVINKPKPDVLEEFLGLVPMLFKVVVVSVHGYFGQSNVLGLPDTGGQVVYILDQVRALEKEMRERLNNQGLFVEPEIVVLTRLIPDSPNTTCSERLEPIWGTENSKILRVPFRDEGGVIPHWISRFNIWPHLESFALESEREILSQLGGKPDLIIGNYSDGNLVASLLSERLEVTQCNIAHALEKTKYLYSDLYWMHRESEYHFSVQYTADLVAMNAADFIITSTFQEIAGREDSIGQYESYESFTLPGLYQVTKGIELFDPKFNIISPGANSDIFFPYYKGENRLFSLIDDIKELIYGEHIENTRGAIKDEGKPLIFSLARLDRIKNLTSLLRWYGKSEVLQEKTNLLLIAGHVDATLSSDDEEREQIGIMHALFEEYGLDDKVRWIGKRLDKQLTGELYRYIADQKGVFVQPALFEAFGLTVIEAMSTGLPVFATKYGGPLEIIEEHISGFHLDPNDDESSIVSLETFFEDTDFDKQWLAISKASIKRVEEYYNWERYVSKLTTLSKVYSFWKHVSKQSRAEMKSYIDMFYGLMYRELVKKNG